LELTPLDESSQADEFTCNMEGVPTDSSNFVLRALELMREKTGSRLHFTVNLIKQVPAQAGLGGGSANAATAMWGANELMGRPASLEQVRRVTDEWMNEYNELLSEVPLVLTKGCNYRIQMVEWSAELGSDMTFFLSRGTAYCTGRGEIMSSIDPPLPSGTKLCIVKPDIGLSTPAVFKAMEYDKLSCLDPEETLLPTFLKGVDQVPSEYFINDLEFPAFKCLPELKDLKDELSSVAGFDHVMMSGSGTSIFCLGQPDDVEQFKRTFAERDGLQVFFSEFINRPDGVWFESP
jgi:4-diphosphocytidyl-2-C-methyl-D-erythritol kinase